LLWDVLINRHTSDSSGFAPMIARLNALSNGNSRSPRAKARSKPSSEGTGGLHSAGLGTAAQTSPIATCRTITPPVMPVRAARGAQRPVIKFLAELGEHDIDRLTIAQGERILHRLPVAVVAGLKPDERRDLARAFGRPWLRRLQEQRRALAATE
jgi:hypothetical protein